MAVLGTTIWKIHPGKMQDFLTNVTTAKKIFSRLGAQVRLLTQMVGSNAPCSILVVESSDWKAYGELQAKLQSDSEWQSFFQKAIATNRDPAAEMIGTGLSVEVPVG